MDVYSAAWLVADCGADLAASDAEVWDTVDRFTEHDTVQQFVHIAARFTALRDMAARRPTEGPPASCASCARVACTS